MLTERSVNHTMRPPSSDRLLPLNPYKVISENSATLFLETFSAFALHLPICRGPHTPIMVILLAWIVDLVRFILPRLMCSY